MNTKTFNSSPDKMKSEALVVLGEVELFKPDIVLTVDDDAFREVGLKLTGRSYPVVFTGMNGRPESQRLTTGKAGGLTGPIRALLLAPL